MYFWSSEAKNHKRVRGTPDLCTALGQTAPRGRLSAWGLHSFTESTIDALCVGPTVHATCFFLPVLYARWCVCVRERERERERIILGSPVWAFWNVSNIYVHSNLGFNILPQPLCLRKEEPAYLTALFLLFKLSLPSCHGCRSWPWLFPADWKGWLLDLYVTSLILERLSEVLHRGWVSTSFITDFVSCMKVQGDLRSWHLLTRSSLQEWSLTCYLTRFVTET